MNRATLFALALLAGAPALGLAQTPPPSGGTNAAQPNTNLQVQRATPVTSTKSTMYEDIEIMRRILSRELRNHLNVTCVSCHVAVSGTPHLAPGNAFSPDGPSLGDPNQLVSSALMHARNIAASPNVPTGSAHAVDVDGVYLSDYGVVFHVAMPAHAAVRIDPSKLVVFRSAVDDWDRTRRELRGEAPDKAASPETKKTVDVVDVLLRLMAENGRHFSKLGEKEKLTIVVKFRPAVDPHGKINRTILGGVSDTLDTGRLIWSNASPQTSGAGNPLRSTNDTTPMPPVQALPNTAVSDFELLGDLQLKQGKVQEAITAYEKAVETPAYAPRKSLLYRKLAEAYLKSGGKSDALAKAIDYLQRSQNSIGKTTAALAASEFHFYDRNSDGFLDDKEMAPQLMAELADWDTNKDGKINLEEYGRYYAARMARRNAETSNKDRELQPSKLILTAPKSLLDTAKTMSPEEFRKGVRVERIPIAQTSPPKAITPVR